MYIPFLKDSKANWQKMSGAYRIRFDFQYSTLKKVRQSMERIAKE